MANPVVANILKTGAVLWYAPTGETVPDETSVAFGGAWGGNWARVGYTKEPLALIYTDTRHSIKVQEVLGVVREFRIEEDAMLETVLAELTGAYLQLAAGGQGTLASTAAGAGQKAYEQITLGGEEEITEKSWGFEGIYLDASGNDFPVRVFVHKGTAKINGNIEFSKKSDDYVGIPIQIHVLADTSSSDRMFTFQRVTAAATS